MAIKDGLLAEYDHEVATTRRMLERVPDDRIDWKPHERSRSLGELATHLGDIPGWGEVILGAGSFDLANLPRDVERRASRASVLDHFDGSVSRTRAVMDRPDAEYLARWTLERGGHEMFSMPRLAAFRSFVLGHLIHHRGQFSVYLRLNGVAVPPVYGPSADEG